MTALSSKVTALKNSVGGTTDAASANGSVYARIKKNATDISTNTADINATKEKVSGLDTKVTANTEAIATKASNEDLTALSSKVTALKNSVGDTTDAAKVDGSVYARIAKNKADIATKANQSDIPTAVQLVVKTI